MYRSFELSLSFPERLLLQNIELLLNYCIVTVTPVRKCQQTKKNSCFRPGNIGVRKIKLTSHHNDINIKDFGSRSIKYGTVAEWVGYSPMQHTNYVNKFSSKYGSQKHQSHLLILYIIRTRLRKTHVYTLNNCSCCHIFFIPTTNAFNNYLLNKFSLW